MIDMIMNLPFRQIPICCAEYTILSGEKIVRNEKTPPIQHRGGAERERFANVCVDQLRFSTREARRLKRFSFSSSFSFSGSWGSCAAAVNRTSVTRRRAVRVTTPV